MLCERSSGISDVSEPDATLFGLPGTGHRFPDLAALHNGRQVVFELQISKTYLPVISDREAFYRRNGIYLFWLVHDFEAKHERQTERDIVAMRSRQVFELDDEAVRATLESGSLTLRVHWHIPESDGPSVSERWDSKLVKMEELYFDEYLVEAMAANPWHDESLLLRETHSDVIARFEDFWIKRDKLLRELRRRTSEEFLRTRTIDDTRTADAVLRRALAAILEASGTVAELASRVADLRFDLLLDRLLFLRDGINRFNKQNITGAIDTVLQNWPHFTDTLVAVAAAYGHDKVLRHAPVCQKIRRNLLGDDMPPVSQCHEFDRVVAVLCPKAASWVRSTPFAYL
jgi:hypothetical protein